MARLLGLAFLLLACSDAPASTQESATTKRLPRVLVVSGANNHDWEWTTPSIVRILEASGKFEVEHTYEPAKTFVEKDLVDYSAFVLDYNGPRWGDAADAAFLEALETHRVGVVVVHAADNAFPGWVEYEEMVGDLWRQGTGHGRFHPFDVEVIDRGHPISATLPTLIKHPDELYHKLVNTQSVERRVLAHAFSDPETGGTGNHEPMVLVKDWRGARVVHTPLGHVWRNVPTSQASHRDPQFQGLLVRCMEWAATGQVAEEAPRPITPTEAAAGWRSLMDLEDWAPRSGAAKDGGWSKVGECFVVQRGAGDLVTKATYTDFELEWEWKATIAGNSGVKYRVPPGTGGIVAPEYQVLDAGAEVEAKHRAGSLYAMYEVEEPQLAPWGYFNRSRIVVRGDRIEHWLNGVRTVAATVGSEDWEARRAASKFKDRDGFGVSAAGHIALQEHGDEVWFRNVRVRDLSAMDGQAEVFLPGPRLEGWSRVGDADYRREKGDLIGTAGPERKQSFLYSDEELGDFVLEVDLRMEKEGNSGIQVRSHVLKGRMAGYQIEIDPTPRAWSGGVFEEGRRGWLDDLKDDDTARAAFSKDGWNRYRIECIGPRIRTWVNGVQTADHLDGVDLTGSVGFQIHGGDDDITMRWRGPRIVRLGEHTWTTHGPLALDGVDWNDSERGLLWLTGFGTAAGLRCTVGGERATVMVGDHEVDLTQASGWSPDRRRTLTLLRASSRVVVQIDGETLADLPRVDETLAPTGGHWLPVSLMAGTATEWLQLGPK